MNLRNVEINLLDPFLAEIFQSGRLNPAPRTHNSLEVGTEGANLRFSILELVESPIFERDLVLSKNEYFKKYFINK